MKKSTPSVKTKVTLSFQTDPEKDVFIAGTFNDWQPGKTRLKSNGDGRNKMR